MVVIRLPVGVLVHDKIVLICTQFQPVYYLYRIAHFLV